MQGRVGITDMDWSSPENGQSSPPTEVDATRQPGGEASSLGWTVVTQEVLALLGRKWAVPVVRELRSGPRRSFQLAQSIKGITPKVLTETLRFLERDGVIQRVLHDDGHGSKSIAYQLTRLGQTLTTPIEALHRWGRDHLDEVHRSRQQSETGTRD